MGANGPRISAVPDWLPFSLLPGYYIYLFHLIPCLPVLHFILCCEACLITFVFDAGLKQSSGLSTVLPGQSGFKFILFFFLDKKETKNQEKTILSSHQSCPRPAFFRANALLHSRQSFTIMSI